jgi:hypothetical protein
LEKNFKIANLLKGCACRSPTESASDQNLKLKLKYFDTRKIKQNDNNDMIDTNY